MYQQLYKREKANIKRREVFGIQNGISKTKEYPNGKNKFGTKVTLLQNSASS
jgi:hypothetical protein